jgi:pimeloyl-ACP methyl ester carboxylesterase
MATDYLDTRHGRRLAFRYTPPRTARTFVWLSGFKSDMQGSKVTALERWATGRGEGFLAFDYSGHGASDGAFEAGTISAWREDMLDLLEALTEGPLILVGSSMGGWMALLATQALGTRVTALVLIAPAPDFTQKLMWPGLDDPTRRQILDTGKADLPSEYGDPYPITRALIEDGARWCLLDAPIAFDGPVRILQGGADPDVPWRHALLLSERLSSPDVVLTLIKDGDHRLSRPQDMARLIAACEAL